MKKYDRIYHKVTVGVFLIIAILHACRIIFDWGALIAGFRIPLWVSWLAVLLAGSLAIVGFNLEKRK